MKYKEATLHLDGSLDKFSIPLVSKKLESFQGKPVKFVDLAEVTGIDSAGVAFLDKILTDFALHKPVLKNCHKDIENSIETFSSLNLQPRREIHKQSFFENLGDKLILFATTSKEAFYLIADIFFWSFVGLFNKKGQRKGSVIQQSVLIGVDALGILGLLSFILGLILALQSAVQLRQFGANIFVADLMAISMVTEMGPMLTAIILAGRSGSAIASEIATMKVTEEIDALKMMAINPIRYVVVPKFHAISLCIPLLVTASTLIGIFGGLLIAVTYLDLSAVVFFNRVFEVLTLKDAVVGLGKSFFFAWVIVIIGSYYGFNVQGGAEGVGKVTTQSVVASIFWVIILDAVNSLIFYF